MNRIESLFWHKGYKCVVLFTSAGHRCGYAAVEPTHPLYGIEYNQDIKSPELLQEIKSSPIGKKGIIDLFCWDGEETRPSLLFDVHGGLTYSGGHSRYPHLQVDPVWWFGFDCAHCDDGKDWESCRKYFPPNKWKSIYEIEKRFSFRNEIPRSQAYVEQECRNLADQLQCVADILKETRIQIGE